MEAPFEEALVARMVAAATAAADRFHWADIPQGTVPPTCSMQVVDSSVDYHHSGPTDLQFVTVQFNCWGASYLDAKLLSRQVREEMEQVRYGSSGIDFDEGLVNRRFDRAADTLEDGTKVLGVTMDILVPFRPA